MSSNMADIKLLLKTEGPTLMPFFICVVTYFAFVRDPNGELCTTILKCCPIVCLMLYVVLNGFTGMKEYSQLILLGLMFSCGGDVLLNVDLFPYGMGLFACAQICYVFAFGYKPWKWSLALPLYMAGAAFVVTVFKKLDDVLSIGLPIYVALLLTACCCSLAHALDNICFLNIFRAVGSTFFVISDGLIGVDMFLIKVPNARIWIMFTYYVAQFAIALSQANKGTKAKSSKNLKRNITNVHCQMKSKD